VQCHALAGPNADLVVILNLSVCLVSASICLARLDSRLGHLHAKPWPPPGPAAVLREATGHQGEQSEPPHDQALGCAGLHQESCGGPPWPVGAGLAGVSSGWVQEGEVQVSKGPFVNRTTGARLQTFHWPLPVASWTLDPETPAMVGEGRGVTRSSYSLIKHVCVACLPSRSRQ